MQQITKYKCEEFKNNKLVKSLQDKICQIAPNASNTSSNFMMPSEFKTFFDEFMTNVLSTAMSNWLEKPKLYTKLCH